MPTIAKLNVSILMFQSMLRANSNQLNTQAGINIPDCGCGKLYVEAQDAMIGDLA